MQPNSREAEKVNHIVINKIYGGTVYMAGGHQNVQVQHIEVGNWEDLRRALLAVGIGEDEIGQLSQAVQQDGKSFGVRVKGWISKNAEKVLDNGIKVGTSVGTTLLTEYLKHHFGMT